MVAELAALEGERRSGGALVDAGLVVPHWPTPWGRDAGAVEQVVIDEKLAPPVSVAPTSGSAPGPSRPIIAQGTEQQRERWVDADH